MKPLISCFWRVDPLVTEPDFTESKPENAGGIFNTNNLSIYSFAYNNPINNIDLDGRCPWCIGGLTGAAFDYGFQVAANFAQGKSLSETFTDVDGESIATSAVIGAAGVGLANVVKKDTKFIKAPSQKLCK